ncbi:MAG: hypothetical protein U9O06_07690 [Euryarchaeota archaeon]|nr:hypothetical protein [Euryarchaeota archaeon]
MDLLDTITGQTETSRRALIRGAILGVAGITGVTAAQTDGADAISYFNDDEESTVQSADLADDPGDGGDGSDGGSGGSRGKEVVSQVDLTERDGRVTLRLGAYERVIGDFNQADGNSVGNSAWRVDGKLAARSGVSFRAYEGDSVVVTLQNPTPVPYSLSISTADGDGERLAADNRGVTVHAGGIETLVVDELAGGEYAYEVETLTRPIEPLVGRLLVDSESDSAS